MTVQFACWFVSGSDGALNGHSSQGFVGCTDRLWLWIESLLIAAGGNCVQSVSRCPLWLMAALLFTLGRVAGCT